MPRKSEPWPPGCCVAAFFSAALKEIGVEPDPRTLAFSLKTTVGPSDPNPWGLPVEDDALRGVTGDRVFSYRRGKKGSEARLRDLRSVGIGGHIDLPDDTLPLPDHTASSKYRQALQREVEEEVVVGAPWCETCVALINDDSNAVGQVHFGVVHIVRLSTPEIRKREQKIAETELVPIEAAVREIECYETWSQLCLGNIRGLLRTAEPAVAG